MPSSFELLRSEVHLTQSKLLTTARSAMKRFPLSTLIRLYELLKNSRLHPGNPGDNNKEASCEAALVLCTCLCLVEDDGLEPTTPALSRRCSNQLSYRPKPVASNSDRILQPGRWRQPSNNR